jgi:uncharacterized damage-inducible protein DinB
MFRYNKWALSLLLEACRELPEARLDAHPSGISGTVRELLMHTVGGQETLVLRSKGRQNEGELTRWSAWPGFDELVRRATDSSDELIAVAGDSDLGSNVDLPWRGKVYRFPKAFFLVHAMEHGVEHRTEIKVALNQLGIETPDLDGWPYSISAGYGAEVESGQT